MNCPHCRASTPQDARFCPACGKATDAAASINRETLLLAAIGPGAEHYLPRFLAREQGASGLISWHWPAFFATFGWLLYRKMYGLATAYAAISLTIGLIATPILVATAGTLGSLLSLFLNLALFAVPALFAGALYHRHCKKVIGFTQRYQPDPERQLEQIRLSGGTAGGCLIPILLLFASLPLVGILAAIALPAYQDYTMRASTSGAYAQMLEASRAVNGYYASHKTLPPSLEDAGFVSPSLPRTAAISLGNDGVISARLSHQQEEKTLQLRPTLAAEGQLVWSCHSGEIPDRQLPMACRTEQN